jgi:hypothetical protein
MGNNETRERQPKVPFLTDAELTDIVQGRERDGIAAIERVPEEQILLALAELLTMRAMRREINDMTRPSEIDQEATR